MERDNETLDVIELGVASVETQGGPGPAFEIGGLEKPVGISDD